MNDSTEVQKPNAVPTPAPAPTPAPLKATTVQFDDPAAIEAAKWGRVDEDGNVWLRSSEGERMVGQYAAGGTERDALGLYVRRFLDLQAQVALLEARVQNISPEEARKSLKSLNAELVEPAVVGDVESLRERAQSLETAIDARAEIVAAERAAAKEEALAIRTQIVEAAEALAAQDPAHTHWRDSREQLTALLDDWKNHQRHGARIDRTTENALWKRFSSARTQFDRHRRQYFSELETHRKAVIARKEEIIARAEELQYSTDWGATASAFRTLMDDWKQSGRTTKKDDDRLWDRFRAAQQVFFDARSAHNSELDHEFSANLVQKEELLKQAEKLLPVENVEYAKEQIRAIGDKWDEIGRVPRADVARIEGRMREIENAIRDAENQQWAKSDPEKSERSSGMAAQLEALITELEGQLEEAKAAGNDKLVKEHTEALEARKAWLAALSED